VDAVDLGQLPDTPAGLVVGQQRLDLVRGQAPQHAAQLSDVRTPRILELRISPRLVGLTDPPEQPFHQGFRSRRDV
jgi:hypothetical protein